VNHDTADGFDNKSPSCLDRTSRKRIAQWELAAREVASQIVDSQGSSRWSVAAAAAALWCGLFACLHLFWALGGSIGLASSAGHDLAERRPASFVVFGLFGVALLLLIGIAAITMTQCPRVPRRRRRVAALLVAFVGAGLAIRGTALEVLLATNAGGLRASIGPLETHWSLVLWNPWFTFGGALFIVTAIQASLSGSRRGLLQ